MRVYVTLVLCGFAIWLLFLGFPTQAFLMACCACYVSTDGFR